MVRARFSDRPDGGRLCRPSAIHRWPTATIPCSNFAILRWNRLIRRVAFTCQSVGGWSTVFAILALACTLFTSSGRGLPALLSRQNLVDDRETFSEELIQK